MGVPTVPCRNSLKGDLPKQQHQYTQWNSHGPSLHRASPESFFGAADISLSWVVRFELHIAYCNMLDWGMISRLVCRPPPHMCNRFILIILFWTEAQMFFVFFKQLQAAAWSLSRCWPDGDRCKRAGYMSNADMWLTCAEQITWELLQHSHVLMGLFSGM